MTQKRFSPIFMAAVLFLAGCSGQANTPSTNHHPASENTLIGQSSKDVHSKESSTASSMTPATANSEQVTEDLADANEDSVQASNHSAISIEISDDKTEPVLAKPSQDPLLPAQNTEVEVISNPVPATTQETGYYCGPAVLQSLLAYHGISASQEELASELKTHPVTGTEYEDLARVASIRIFGQEPIDNQASGYRAEIYKTRSFTDEEVDKFLSRLSADLVNGDPVFVGLNCRTTRPQDGIDAVHLVLVYGMSRSLQTGEIVSVEVMDPSYLAQKDGTAYFSIPTSALIQAIRDCKEGAYVW